MKNRLIAVLVLFFSISLFAQNISVVSGDSTTNSKRENIQNSTGTRSNNRSVENTTFIEQKIISPIAGVWCNKQMLIIDNSDNGEYYYSLNGSEPELSGFAYDGPVLIDLTGDVTLKITRIVKKNVQKYSVNYKVLQDYADKTTYKNFISSFIDTGVLNYTSGTELEIPSELQFSFGSQPDSFIQGMSLSTSDKSVLSRYIPCTLWNEKNGKKWRFMIKTFPQAAKTFSRKNVPFYITDWDYITFTDRNYIYKIDKEFWSLPAENESRFLDRSISHMVSWQSIDYEFGNPIEYFVIPPKPQIIKTENQDGSVCFKLEGDSSYTFSVLYTNEKDFHQLYNEIGVDTFFGDNVSGDLDIGIFSNSVYQGKISTSYDIKKRPPAMPKITSTAKSFYSRKPVKVTITGEPNSDLFISTSSPYLLKDSSDMYSPEDLIFAKEVKMSPYKKSENQSINLYFEPQGEGASYFKVRAYSRSDKNKGKVAEYSVIIDQYNFYYDEKGDSSNADGTANRPYTDFKKCIDAVNKVGFAKLHVKGAARIPEEEISFLTNCTIINDGNASLCFSPESHLFVKNSTLELAELQIEVSSDYKKIKNQPTNNEKKGSLIKLDNSVLNIKDCQISGQFQNNGNFIDSYQSVVNINDDLISLSAKDYSSCVSGVKTKLNVNDSIINVQANTAVVFSLNDSDILLKNNSLKVIALKGRIAELFKVKGTVLDNSFKSEMNKPTNSSAIYKDSQTKIREINNEQYGF
ncbi:MAG: chitobiase/beta-hexosaminidase C-terminal domain-containing protein [Treponema sp.]|nr:chitobiase/beta-hexosaminidase C-terminal domain-containing protein [Treponema sp.]